MRVPNGDALFSKKGRVPLRFCYHLPKKEDIKGRFVIKKVVGLDDNRRNISSNTVIKINIIKVTNLLRKQHKYLYVSTLIK